MGGASDDDDDDDDDGDDDGVKRSGAKRWRVVRSPLAWG